MEGNGYYGESEQGYGDGWGTNSRRNVGMYSSESAYMQRGLYYGGTTGLTGYGGMGQSQRIASSVNAMMGYGYGDMEAPSSHQDTTDHSSMHSYDYSASTLGSQNSYPQRSDATATQKRVVSSFEENMALMQGGSYAGSSPYGRGASKKSSAPSDYTDSKTGGSLGSLGQKGSGTYKSVAPPDVGTFSYGYDSYSSQKRQTNVSDFEPRMFDETRYRIGSGMPSRGRGRGRGGRGKSFMLSLGFAVCGC
ncbi:hypothetical protein SK128_003289 [Halocaridina rubra]|uniref:Uncharacterized protein n=1 Tax=Halocaridina rubra TaxID=373956 RepID=A0AAN8XCG7_HALRR